MAWEGAYRLTAFDEKNPDAGGWRPWVFPSAFQVIDSTLSLLNITTHFGEPFGAGWPWEGPPLLAKKSYGIASSHLVVGNLVSASRLAVGFGISVLLSSHLMADVERTCGAAHVNRRIATYTLFGMMNWIYNWYDPLGDLSVEVLSQSMCRLFLGGYVGMPVSESVMPHLTAG